MVAAMPRAPNRDALALLTDALAVSQTALDELRALHKLVRAHGAALAALAERQAPPEPKIRGRRTTRYQDRLTTAAAVVAARADHAAEGPREHDAD